jgi:8-oxo-dGTP pyrophosphatase MutT (NUDIX family)
MTIVSYGLICYKENDSKTLLVQRRDSIEFMSFVKGNFETADMSRMTRTELDRLRTAAFSYLWYDLFGARCRMREDVKQRFEAMREDGSLAARIDRHYADACEETAWGFPKGRPNGSKEQPIRCAVREFCEETGYDPSDVTPYPDVPPVEDEIRGTDGRTYRHVFFFARLADDRAIPRKRPMAKEVRRVGWFSASGDGQEDESVQDDRKDAELPASEREALGVLPGRHHEGLPCV